MQTNLSFRQNLRPDILAGITVAFVAVPQSMAYAIIAGVAPQYGLYAFIIGAIVGALAGSSRHLQTGPTNATSIVVASSLAVYHGSELHMPLVFLLGLMAGIIQLFAGLLKLGNLTQFISRSVLVGFIAGAALLIVANQLPSLLGVSMNSQRSVLAGVIHISTHFAEVNWLVFTVGVGTMAGALLLNRFSPKTRAGIPILPSYLIAIILAAVVVMVFDLHEQGVQVIGAIPAGLPPLSMPVWDWRYIQELTPGAIAIALIGFAEATSSAKTVAWFAGYRLNIDRDFIGQGLAKIAASFTSGVPTSGSPTRTLLNYRAGARSKFANVYAGIILTLIVLFLGPFVKFIPRASLAGIVLLIAASMIDWGYVKLAFHTTRGDALAMSATFIAALIFPLDVAIYIGVGLSLALFLQRVRIPQLAELEYDPKKGFRELHLGERSRHPEIVIVNLEGSMFFGAMDQLEIELEKVAARPELKVLILRLKRANSLDATSILALQRIYQELTHQGKDLLICGTQGEVEKILERSGLVEMIGEKNIFHSGDTLLTSTRKAFRTAEEMIKRGEGSPPANREPSRS